MGPTELGLATAVPIPGGRPVPRAAHGTLGSQLGLWDGSGYSTPTEPVIHALGQTDTPMVCTI